MSISVSLIHIVHCIYIMSMSVCMYVYYSMSPLSMAIHRVGETLLIDEFAAPINLHSGVCTA